MTEGNQEMTTIDHGQLESDVARRLAHATANVTAIPPVRTHLEGGVDAAYRVQARLVRGLPGRRSGRKVGLTSTAVRRQLGVDQPDFGVLLDAMAIEDGAVVDVAALIAPRIEAEVAFVLAADIDDPTPDAVRAAVDYAVAALEIVDSRIAGWDISIVDTVADNASSARYVLGTTRRKLDDFAPRDVTMQLRSNGEMVSEGTGAACLDDPLNALIWVAQTAARLGDPLRAGEVVLSGALGPMVPLREGDDIEATVSELGTVRVTARKVEQHA